MLPKVNRISGREAAVTRFGGINLSDGTPLGEWEKLHNMWFSAYPALKNVRGVSRTAVGKGNEAATGGFLEKDGQYIYTVTDGIYIGSEKVSVSLSEGRKKLVSMGAYVIILPDFVCVNTADSPCTVSRLSADGSEVTGAVTEYNQNQTYPTVSIFKRMYIDVPVTGANLPQYSAGDNVELTWQYNGREMKKQFTVSDISVEDYTADGCKSVIFDTSALDTTYFYLEGKAQPAQFRIPHIENVTMKKVTANSMDFVVEHNNRLWGCSSAKHEIYCSKLGEPLKWGEYKGISTDSWAATVGSDGDFTGVTVFNDSVLFFKENCVHIVYGTKASNFSVNTITLRGVQKGSENSFCISEGLLYYKAPEGIFCFNGSSSSRVDYAFGKDITETMTGVADDTRIIMAQTAAVPYITRMYVYDCIHSCWYTRDGGSYGGFPGTAEIINGYSADGKLKLVLFESALGILYVVEIPRDDDDTFDGVTEYPVFEMESGELNRSGGIMRYITKLKFVIGVVKPAYDTENCYVRFSIKLSYDGGEWETVYSYDSRTSNTAGEIFTVPVIPRRCGRMKLKIDGEVNRHPGDTAVPSFTLYGIYYNTQGGSELV